MLVHLSKTLGQLTCQYDKTILMGDFHLPVENNSLENFMNNLFPVQQERTKEKSNKKELFKNNDVIEVGIFDQALKRQLLK